jgi:protein-disulfide isomerase
MLKSLLLTLVLFIASLLLIVETTFASPQGTQLMAEATITQSQASPEAKVKVSPDNQQSADNKEEQKPASANTPVVKPTRSSYPQPPNPYNMDAMDQFSDQLYGEGS